MPPLLGTESNAEEHLEWMLSGYIWRRAQPECADQSEHTEEVREEG